MLIRSLALSTALAATAVSAELLTIPIRKVPDKEHHANILSSHCVCVRALGSTLSDKLDELQSPMNSKNSKNTPEYDMLSYRIVPT